MILERGGFMGARRKATFYVDSDIHKALRLKAAEDDVSPSELLNEMLAEELKEYLEDLEDRMAVKARQKEKGQGISLEKLKKKLKLGD
jgi:hypothetical protein